MAHQMNFPLVIYNKEGAQWLSGRVLDSRLKGCGFEPHRRHCVVSLMGCKESNQTKQSITRSLECNQVFSYRCFDSAKSVFCHVCSVHLKTEFDGLCKWEGCESLVRKRWSLFTHIQVSIESVFHPVNMGLDKQKISA